MSLVNFRYYSNPPGGGIGSEGGPDDDLYFQLRNPEKSPEMLYRLARVTMSMSQHVSSSTFDFGL